MFETKSLPEHPTVTAPDGSDVRVLCRLEGGSLAHFELKPGKTSLAVMHESVEEIWYFLGGHGEMWRKLGDQEEVVNLEANICINIPRQTCFQFRSIGPGPLAAVAITMPPWPGEGEAHAVDGIWALSK